MHKKMKTRKSALKRFRLTKKGKVLHRSQGRRHLRSQKSKKQLRNLKTIKKLAPVQARKIRRMIGK